MDASPMPSQAQLQEADGRLGIVHVISGKDANGKDFYAYVSVRPSRYEEFILISRAGEEMDVAEFGNVLESGFGREPSPEIRRHMEEKYGVDHHFLTNLQKEIVRHQKA